MALDTKRKRRAAAAIGTVMPPVIIPDGSTSSFDRAMLAWSYRAGAVGLIYFFNTVMGSGVDSVTYRGVTIDENGNLRTYGKIYEGE